jgi:hypothetical protein
MFFLFVASVSLAQQSSNWRSKVFFATSDTIQIDSLSIIPNSERLELDGKLVNDSNFYIDYAKSQIVFAERLHGKSLRMSYRVFPLLFTKEYAHKSMDQIEQSDPGRYDFFTIKETEKETDIFAISGLNKNGSISRGVNFGNNQDLSVNSNLDLQLSGKITDEIGIQAAISDNSIPIQPEGNTQQLQDFDRVYIQLFDDRSKLIAGDFRISRPEGYFMNFNKKVQGAGFSTEIITKEEAVEKNNGILKTSINAAVSRGKFARNIIPGEEGNQGPYRLQGAENESFIIILSGTEKVYLNGRLMSRGQDNDYVIDYNTSEVTFMPQQMITKDMRIVIEFQYSERNYSRSVIFSENQYNKEKLQLNFNVYSEQDHKNQPLQQDLSDEQKRVLTDVGDTLSQAVVSGIDTSGFIDDQVMYKLIDTLGYQDVLVYSKNPDSAIYRARFSRVGQGNYIQIRSDANGRVFQWVEPVNGVPQGNYAPVVQLVTPKKRQMITAGLKYNFSERTKLNVEGAFTNNDLNTFSEIDEADDHSYGMKIDFQHSEILKQIDSNRAVLWNSAVFFEQIGEDFQFIERYRDVEFDRDWNIRGLQLSGKEQLLRASTGIASGQNFLNYELGAYVKGSDYNGAQHGYSGSFNKKGFSIRSRGSYLQADATNNSEFLRHYTTATQEIGGFRVGGYLEQERILFYQESSDSLQNSSFDRIIWKAFVEKGDSSEANLYRLGYSEIYDYYPQGTNLAYTMKSENFDLDFNMAKNPSSRLSGKLGYRRLMIQREELTTEDPENTLLGRLEYDAKIFDGLISSNTFYQIGSGQELRREFSFLEVNDGQGTHLWNDYNDNGVKELNEFEVAGANNQFQANYIKVFTPTNDYIRVYSNQFNQVLFLRPNALLSGEKGWRKLLGKFSNKSAYRAERKTQLAEDIYNPLNTDVSDSSLISINSSFSNTLYFNRLSSNFGIEYFYLSNKSKNLLTNGFESRQILQHELRGRYNLSRLLSIENRLSLSERSTGSEFFENRNYNIESREVEPEIIYQPSVKFRLSVSVIYAERQNLLGDEYAYNRTAATELRFNEAGKGSFSLNLQYIDITFNGTQNNSLGFEMLDGLSPGGNITWNVVWQRNLSNSIQLNLNYGGRKSEDLRTIHTGGMQLRAFF